MGKYPVGTFKITWPELEELGFVEQVKANISKYKYHKESNDWFEIETFNF